MEPFWDWKRSSTQSAVFASMGSEADRGSRAMRSGSRCVAFLAYDHLLEVAANLRQHNRRSNAVPIAGGRRQPCTSGVRAEGPTRGTTDARSVHLPLASQPAPA